jgi:hypothetical protein
LEKNIESGQAIDIMESAAVAPDTSASSFVNAAPLTKATSIGKALSLTKASSIVKAPALAQASTFLKSSSVTKGITNVSDRNLLDSDSLTESDVSVASLNTAAATGTALGSVSEDPVKTNGTTIRAAVLQKVKGIPGKFRSFRSLLPRN